MSILSDGKKMKRLAPALLLLAIGLAAGVVGAKVGESYYQKVELFQQVIDHVSERYVDEYDPGDLVMKAIKGMLGSLDAYSQLLTPDDYKELMVDTRGKFGGIGIEIGLRNGVLTVIAPIEGTPADRLGILAGDRIVGIEGEPTKGWNTMDAVKRLRGPKGTRVTITIEREGLDENIDFTITRDIINVKSVPYSFMVTPEIGYIRLSTFSEKSASEITESIHQLKEQGCQALILDLRYNPGGLLTQAVQVSELFLQKGQLIVSTRGRVANQNNEYRATKEETETDIPIVLLINQFSASASEIVAGSLQDHDRALILGKTSFGKGSVQTLFSLEGEYALKLTTAKYYTPSGRSIHRAEDHEKILAETESKPPPEGEEFFTDLGRTVYGGGGIRPDLFIESKLLSPVEQNLLRKPVFFNYAIHYQSTHSELPEDFQVTDEIIRDFSRKLETDEGIELSESEIQEAREFISLRLTYEILRAFKGEAAARKKVIHKDTEVVKAVELIEEGKDLEGMFSLASRLSKQAEEMVEVQ
ncbi:MAG: S41 family peptidase [Candidatus Glassbacteria bacterium]